MLYSVIPLPITLLLTYNQNGATSETGNGIVRFLYTIINKCNEHFLSLKVICEIRLDSGQICPGDLSGGNVLLKMVILSMGFDSGGFD